MEFWIIVAIWIVLAALQRATKKAKQAGPGQGTARAPVAGPEDGLMGELGRALQQLRKAEGAARRGPSKRLQQDAARRPAPQPKVWRPKPQPPAPKRAPVRALADDDWDETSEEDAGVIEVKDYDEEAERVIEERRRGAERAERAEVSVEELSAEQARRRAETAEGEAIGGRAEHQAWHRRVAAQAAVPAPAKKPPSVLARFATGRARDAVVLSEILGSPLGERG